MKKLITTVYFLGWVLFASGVLNSQDMKVFGIVKDMETRKPKKVDSEKNRDYLKLDIGMNELFRIASYDWKELVPVSMKSFMLKIEMIAIIN